MSKFMMNGQNHLFGGNPVFRTAHVFMNAFICVVVLVLTGTGPLWSQEVITDKEAYERQYQERIRKEVLNGVYIPADLEDAFRELERLSDPEMVVKFKDAAEDTVATKLHFSLGKWMIGNWGFYEGSRLSHFLKESGLSFPDDMARFIIVSWHRKLNGRPLGSADLIREFQEIRKQEAEERQKRKKVISIGKKASKNR